LWIDLDGSKFNVHHAFALRPVGKGNKQCTLFPVGADPVAGGFLIDLPLDEVFELIQNARLTEIAQMIMDESDDQPAIESDPIDQ
jgi:hypothetical protein